MLLGKGYLVIIVCIKISITEKKWQYLNLFYFVINFICFIFLELSKILLYYSK